MESHDDRVRGNVCKFQYLLSVALTKPQEAKSNESKAKRSLEAKWNRITKNINNATTTIMEAQNELDETQIEDLTETRSQLSELEGLLVP